MSFSSELQKRTNATWSKAVTHRFVDELWAGTVSDAVMRTYISQDFLFCDAFLALMGGAVSNCDSPRPRVLLARQVGFVSTDEDSYFLRAIKHLNAPESPEPRAPTQGFLKLIDEARRAGYAETLVVLLVAEWLYLDWGTRPGHATPGNWLYDEWIELHRGEAFERWVELLKSETDRVAAKADAATRERMGKFFVRAVDLELAFFDAAYE